MVQSLQSPNPCLVLVPEELEESDPLPGAELALLVLEEEVVGDAGVDEVGVPPRRPHQVQPGAVRVPATEEGRLLLVAPADAGVLLGRSGVGGLLTEKGRNECEKGMRSETL